VYLYKFYKLENIVAKKRRIKDYAEKKRKKKEVSIRHLPVFYPYDD